MDNLDKLSEGKDFDTRTAGGIVNSNWVEAKCKFSGSPQLQYIVSLNWGDDKVRETYDDPEKAILRFERLKEEHGWLEC